MLSPGHPSYWFKYLVDYVDNGKIIHELIDTSYDVTEVVLKTMSLNQDQGQFVRYYHLQV